MAMYKVKDIFCGKLRSYNYLMTDVSKCGWMFKDAFNRPYKYNIAQRLTDSLYRGGVLIQGSASAFIGTERPVVFR